MGGFWTRGIIEAFFLENKQGEAVTLNGDRYRVMLNKFSFTKIQEEDISTGRCYEATLDVAILKIMYNMTSSNIH